MNPVYVGQPVKLTYSFRVNGAYVDPASVTLTWSVGTLQLGSDLSTQGGSIQKRISPGRYEAVVPSPYPGDAAANVVSLGAAAGAQATTWTVLPLPAV